jgi:uncharacterized protein
MTNTQIVQKLYEKFGQRDIPAIMELLHDDAVFEDSAALWIDRKPHMVPFSGVYKGKNSIPGFFQKMAETTEITKFEPVKFFENGNHVIAIVNLAGRFKTDGTTGENAWIMVWEVVDGKIKGTRVTTMPGTF